MEEKRAYHKHKHSKLNNNIKVLCRHKGIKIGDLELKLYRAPGYLSRSIPSAEELLEISKIMNVSMDDLMTKDYETEISVLNLLLLARINVENLKEFMSKDDCLKELIRILNEVYG